MESRESCINIIVRLPRLYLQKLVITSPSRYYNSDYELKAYNLSRPCSMFGRLATSIVLE